MSNNWIVVMTRASTLLAAFSLSACGLGSNVLRGPDGRLAACSSAPHCVSSLAADADHKIEPLRYTGSADAAHGRLVKTVFGMQGAAIVIDQPDYVHATYTSALMRYVDDVEFVFVASQPGVIQLRSSSRLGYADLGANRKRTDAIRAAFSATK